MKKRTGSEIRSLFLNYFQSNGHTIVKSSSLIPKSDPTLLFINAGMVQFKSVFQGLEKRDYVRATSAQKCFRASGKHNDLENVGYTARHHTFFEMLGNFSFGDYFKKQAIEYAWDFLINHLELPPEKLYATVYEEDDEAEQIWHRSIGLPLERIVRMGKKDNFWAMGDTGPCGPCSEIIYDQGPALSCGKPDCGVGCDCDRFLEIWNLVFMQFNQDETGQRTPLPRPSIDTGMGLERIAAVVQGVTSNYEIDLIRDIMSFIEELAGIRYGRDPSHDLSIRVIADHSRAVTFLLSDGVLPSNEGRGYVLRRVIRRAIRHGRKLGLTRPFLYQATGVVADIMGEAYPELLQARNLVAQAVRNEEERFLETLEVGLKLLQTEMESIKSRGQTQLSGDVVFKLYDTYGFPVDLTADIARENSITLDEHGFEQAMSSQRSKAREAWKGSGEERVKTVYQSLVSAGITTVFKGYETLQWNSTVSALVRDDASVEAADSGERVQIVTPETPFYGESGGQVGDTGLLEGSGWKATVENTQRPIPELFVHNVVVTEGTIKKGDAVLLMVDNKRRKAIAAHHTATHLLQAALRSVLGDHVHQEGSLVTPERLRFDFTHFSPLSDEELTRVEEITNEKIQENIPVKTGFHALEDALKSNAMALFGEKYGETVRVVAAGDFSRELCGGTHTDLTGDIGFLKIVGESGVAAGVRRIEAVAGISAWRYIRSWQNELQELESVLKTPRSELTVKVKKLLEEEKRLQQELSNLKAKLATSTSRDLLSEVKSVNGVKVLAAQVEIPDPKTLRDFADQLRTKLESGIVVL
ncbi:MAG TPA: alanine--tRNA ligase, partial [Thermodesulfobacteriota bacterium]|nr:alanine--tRNA ligase [Thermodesulfobacteriota bacterium]